MTLPFIKKKNPYELDTATTEQMLSNVFTLCEKAPNSVPLSVLISYSNYRKERYALQRTVIIVILLCFMLLPFFFVVPRIVVSMRDNNGRSNPEYDVSVTTRIPVSEISATIGGRTVPIYELDSHDYVLRPNANGDMTLSVTLLNRQLSSMEITISTVDNDAPVFLSAEMDADQMNIYVSDETGIDFENITLIDTDGNEHALIRWNEILDMIVVEYPTIETDVRIPDLRGNVLLVRLTPTE
ncbi:MAG: hypothetical protein MJ099_04655 [Clostridia bacterium]|nr:hypothetical protein [Clostridia bacterium]